MTRSLLLVLSAAVFAQAPLQCSREPDPALRTYETPPDALYDLAQRFKAKGDTSAWRDTLSYLVERYPSSRFAERAKQDLSGGGADVPPAGSASGP
jgi:outer membrane protein assembly factor BamD (BamD/ComL family)